MNRSAAWLVVLVFSLSTPAAAQESGVRFGTVAGAVLGGAAGFAAGGLIGAWASSRDSECGAGDPDCSLGESIPGFLWGAGAGHTLGIPLGAHVGGGRRGSLGRSVIVSAGIFAAEVLVLNLLVDDGRTQNGGAVAAVAITAPLLQIVSSVLIESSR